MNARIDQLKRFSLFNEPDVQDVYEMEIMSDRMAKQDAKEFNTQVKKNLSVQAGRVQQRHFKARL